MEDKYSKGEFNDFWQKETIRLYPDLSLHLANVRLFYCEVRVTIDYLWCYCMIAIRAGRKTKNRQTPCMTLLYKFCCAQLARLGNAVLVISQHYITGIFTYGDVIHPVL